MGMGGLVAAAILMAMPICALYFFLAFFSLILVEKCCLLGFVL